MCFFGIFCWIAWLPVLVNLYCALGVIVFSIYIVIDTKLIIGGNRRFQLSTDDYVVGALLLYIDIIELFMYLLLLLAKKWSILFNQSKYQFLSYIIFIMNFISFKIINNPVFRQLTTNINFCASKMQASSTQNNKDSAGRRLGYIHS